jgi:DNA-directed RNA polymerase subunit RPC12/RpoP
LFEQGHEWEAVISTRNRGNDCPYCAGQLVNVENCLTTVNPLVASEWHPTKSNSLTPFDFTANSNKKAWWFCSKGHEWEAIISSRNRGNGCPYCAGKIALKENCLATLNPDLAKEWHPTKNKETPENVKCSSNKKVWWICKNGHEWETLVKVRNNGSGCPHCKKKRNKKK